MGWFSDALGSFAAGFRDGRLAALAGSHGRQPPLLVIENLLDDIGWEPDERSGGTIGLHFRNAQGRVKKVFIVTEDGPTVLIASHGGARVRFADVPAQLFAYLTKRNGELPWAAWQAHAAGDDCVGFMVAYTALTQGLTPLILRHLVESVAAEAADLDRKLEQAGLLTD